MKLRISNSNMQLKLDSTEDLEFQDIFKAYNLVMRRNDSLQVDDDQNDSSDINKTDSDESSQDNKPVFKPNNHTSQTKEDVKVGVECPKCGYTGVQTARMGFRYIKCQNCFTKLFLSPANGEWGVKDDKGMMYRANDLFHDKKSNDVDDYSEMFKRSHDSSILDAYSTIPEIEKYLDDHSVKHEGIRLKGLLLDKMKEVKAND